MNRKKFQHGLKTVEQALALVDPKLATWMPALDAWRYDLACSIAPGVLVGRLSPAARVLVPQTDFVDALLDVRNLRVLEAEEKIATGGMTPDQVFPLLGVRDRLSGRVERLLLTLDALRPPAPKPVSPQEWTAKWAGSGGHSVGTPATQDPVT